ncbi:MAG TPA: carbohydrate ABC transporter permease [Chloroflexota bacterium]|nr:carbohydrate ABC transporter permease [Chloroflexota bacterium]
MGVDVGRRARGAFPAAASPAARRARRGKRLRQGAIHLVLLIFLTLTLYPAVALIIFSFKTSLQWENSRWTPTFPLRWQNYQIAWDIISHYLINTTIIATAGTIGATALCSVTAFAFARLRFPGREIFYYAIVFMLIVPSILSLIPQFVLYHNLGLVNTRWALIVSYIVASPPYGVFLFRLFFQGIPEELFESARLDGCNVLDLYWRICLPLSLPIVCTYAIISVQYIWNDYVWPTIAVTDDSLQVMTVGLVKLAHNLTNTVGGDPSAAYGPQFSAYAIGALPIVVLFIFASRYFIEGLVSSGLKL